MRIRSASAPSKKTCGSLSKEWLSLRILVSWRSSASVRGRRISRRDCSVTPSSRVRGPNGATRRTSTSSFGSRPETISPTTMEFPFSIRKGRGASRRTESIGPTALPEQGMFTMWLSVRQLKMNNVWAFCRRRPVLKNRVLGLLATQPLRILANRFRLRYPTGCRKFGQYGRFWVAIGTLFAPVDW